MSTEPNIHAQRYFDYFAYIELKEQHYLLNSQEQEQIKEKLTELKNSQKNLLFGRNTETQGENTQEASSSNSAPRK